MIVFFFCGALCTAASLQAYVDQARARGHETRVLELDVNPITADHSRDLRSFGAAVREATADAPASKRVFFAFSGGAKFAARLAAERDTGVDGLFLLDPVDGPPPFNRPSTRYPVLLESVGPAWRLARSDGGPRMPARLRIVRTEFGEKAGFTGVPCVPSAYGSKWFSERLGAEDDETTTVAGVGHLDALSRKPSLPARSLCPSGGEEASRAATDAVASDFGAFLEGIEAAAP